MQSQNQRFLAHQYCPRNENRRGDEKRTDGGRTHASWHTAVPRLRRKNSTATSCETGFVALLASSDDDTARWLHEAHVVARRGRPRTPVCTMNAGAQAHRGRPRAATLRKDAVSADAGRHKPA
jgi:hypothetical protein